MTAKQFDTVVYFRANPETRSGAKRLLQRARGSIQSPSAWTTRRQARNADGDGVMPDAAAAVAWCAVGAIEHACRHAPRDEYWYNVAGHRRMALAALAVVCHQAGRYGALDNILRSYPKWLAGFSQQAGGCDGDIAPCRPDLAAADPLAHIVAAYNGDVLAHIVTAYNDDIVRSHSDILRAFDLAIAALSDEA